MGKLSFLEVHPPVKPGSDRQEEASPDTVAVKDSSPGQGTVQRWGASLQCARFWVPSNMANNKTKEENWEREEKKKKTK